MLSLGECVPFTTMVNGTSQTNLNVSLCVKGIVQQVIISCKSCGWKHFWYLERNLQGINDKVKLECFIPFRCGHLLLHVTQHDFEWQRF
jgi:hypothetical protein